MKYLTRGAATIAAGLLLSYATASYAADKPTLAFVVNGASDFWKAAEAGVKKAQAELPDFNLELKYPEQSSVAIQQRLMEDLVSAGVKGIMVSAVDPKTSTDGLNKIGSQTALFTTDSDAPDTNRVAYIGSSNVDAGKQAAEIAKKAMPNGGKCIGFVGLLGADNAKERKVGFMDSIKNGKLELLDSKTAHWETEEANTVMTNFLTKYKDIQGVMAANDSMALGVVKALDASGQSGKIKVVGFDNIPSVKDRKSVV